MCDSVLFALVIKICNTCNTHLVFHFHSVYFLHFLVGRTSNAFVHPVLIHRSLKSHTLASRSAYDDFECALLCISHSSCYSFNFHSPSRHCELSYARRNLAAGDFVVDRDFVYSELQFE